MVRQRAAEVEQIMSRTVLHVIGGCGVVLTLGAFFLWFDQLVTDDHRAGVRESMSETFSALEDHEGYGRANRAIRGFGGVGNALLSEGGLLEFEAASLLPQPSEHWEMREYVPAHGQHVFGDTTDADPVALLKLKYIQNRFEDDTKRRKYGTAATYARDGYIVILRLDGNMKGFRAMGEGVSLSKYLKARHSVGPATLVSIDGVAVNQKRQEDLPGYVPQFRLFDFSLGHLLRGEILTNAPDAYVAEVIEHLPVAAFQAILPRPTTDFEPEAGFVTYFEPDITEEDAREEAG